MKIPKLNVGEETLALHLKAERLHFEREYRFCKRKWRFDFAFPDHMLAAEVEGGVYSGGRHTRGNGFIADCEKYNVAAMLGWKVLRYTPDQVHSGLAINEIMEALTKKCPSRLADGIRPDYRVRSKKSQQVELA